MSSWMWLSTHHMWFNSDYFCLMYSVSRHTKYLRVKRKERVKKNRMYLVPLFVWSVSQFPSGLHICQAWHWNCRCHWSWRKLAQRALRCICSLAHGCASHCSAWDWKRKYSGSRVDVMKNDRTPTTASREKGPCKSVSDRGWLHSWFQRDEIKKSYLGPKSSDGQSLRFRDSALAESDGVSPTPLIIKAYQRLKTQKQPFLKCKHSTCPVVITQ